MSSCLSKENLPKPRPEGESQRAESGTPSVKKDFCWLDFNYSQRNQLFLKYKLYNQNQLKNQIASEEKKLCPFKPNLLSKQPVSAKARVTCYNDSQRGEKQFHKQVKSINSYI